MAECQDAGFVASLVQRVKEMAAGEVGGNGEVASGLWPGFDPTAIPLAVYDGAATYLFGHPAPPGEFEATRVGAEPAWRYPGRHEAILANTCIELGGTMVATLMLAAPPDELDMIAGVAIHEMFHVYQARRPGAWPYANEAARFLYPVTDAAVLALRRQEIEALRRAVESETPAAAAGWARRALGARRERFGKLAAELAEYERSLERIEGLAAYVEALATKRGPSERLDGERAGEIRLTCYGTGHALAVLLDRLAPGWKGEFERRLRWLDQELAGALEGMSHVAECEFEPAELEGIGAWANEEVARRLEERRALEEAFAARPGRRLVVEAAQESPLMLAAFDPSNVHVIRRELGVLHTRLLHLCAGESRIEMLREGDAIVEGLTEGVGPHPLFHGVRRVEIVVGDRALHVRESGGILDIAGGGITARLLAREWSQVGDTLRVAL